VIPVIIKTASTKAITQPDFYFDKWLGYFFFLCNADNQGRPILPVCYQKLSTAFETGISN